MGKMVMSTYVDEEFYRQVQAYRLALEDKYGIKVTMAAVIKLLITAAMGAQENHNKKGASKNGNHTTAK